MCSSSGSTAARASAAAPSVCGVVLVERPLERGGEHVRVEDARIRVVENRCLDPSREQRVGLAHEELVERVLAGDEDGEPPALAPGAPPLLPERGDRPREADRDRAVEQPDVDAELERLGGRNAEQIALDEAALDLAALLRRVARPVGREPPRGLGADPLGREAVDELGRLAALREADRPQSALDERGEQPRRVTEGARALPQLFVQERRVPEHDIALGVRRRVRLDDRCVLTREREGELARVRDRGRREQELWLGAVHAGESAEAAENIGDV